MLVDKRKDSSVYIFKQSIEYLLAMYIRHQYYTYDTTCLKDETFLALNS